MTNAERLTQLMTELKNTRENERSVPLLTELLLEEGHDRHEDLVFELGLIGDPRAVPLILKVIKVHFPELVKWNNLHEF